MDASVSDADATKIPKAESASQDQSLADETAEKMSSKTANEAAENIDAEPSESSRSVNRKTTTNTDDPSSDSPEKSSSDGRKKYPNRRSAKSLDPTPVQPKTDESSKTKASTTKSSDTTQPSNNTTSPIRGVALNKKARRATSIAPTHYQDLHVFGKYYTAPETSPTPSEKSPDKCFQTKKPTIIAQNKDFYCWLCHEGSGDELGTLLPCNNCFRVYHKECVEKGHEYKFAVDTSHPNWECYECQALKDSEESSRIATWLSLENLGMCLQKVVSRLINTPSFDLFVNKVSKTEYPDYTKFIYKPVSLSELDKKAMTLQYTCGEALKQDCKLFQHNSAIFNGPSSPITGTARRMVSYCEKELAQIEACPDCYCNSLLRDDFFESPCRIPHPLVWAKYRTFPYWPSKIFQMKPPNSADVRFFGEHDRAIVNLNQIFYYSKNPPEPVKKHMKKFEESQSEVQRYIKRLQAYQSFSLASDKKMFKGLPLGEPFGPINIKIEEDIRIENDKSPSVSPDLMKQVAETQQSTLNTISNSATKSGEKKQKPKSGRKDDILSDVDLSSDSSSSESESDSETLSLSVSKKLNQSKSTKEVKSTEKQDSSSTSNARGKRGLSLGSKVQDEEEGSQTKADNVPPKKKSRRDSSASSASSSATSAAASSIKTVKLEIQKSQEVEIKEDSKKKELRTTKDDAKSEVKTPQTSYNKTRSRRTDGDDSTKMEEENNKSATPEVPKSKESDLTVTKKVNDETEDTDSKVDPDKESADKASEYAAAIATETTALESLEQALDAEAMTSDSTVDSSDDVEVKMEIDEAPSTKADETKVSKTADRSDSNDQRNDYGKDSLSATEASQGEESKLILNGQEPSVGQTSTKELTHLKQSISSPATEETEQVTSVPETLATAEQKQIEESPKVDETTSNSVSPSAKEEAQKETNSGSVGTKKPGQLDAVVSELEETGRGKRTKFKNPALYNSDEEIDPKMFTKSSISKRSKETKETTAFASSQPSGGLAATLQAKKQAIQSPRTDSRPGSPSGGHHSSKHSSSQYTKTGHHGNTSANVKPVILSESSYKSKPKGVVKGTPQPTPPKLAPGPSAEEALVDKITERLSGQIGDLVNQVMSAQTRGDSISRDDIINAILSNNRNPASKNSSAVRDGRTPASVYPPTPLHRKVETRDSPAQVDIPDEMAATQRAEMRRMASEKQKVLEERQKLVDEIGSWQRKYRALKEAEGDRKEQHLNRTRHEFAARIEELRREKNVQLSDLTRHYELLLAEVEKNMSALHKEEIRRLKEERSAEVKEAKRKQWCAYCLKESQYHCCWNTSYCDYKCQQKHWGEHMKTCSQKSKSKKPHGSATTVSGTPESNKSARPSPMASPKPALSAAAPVPIGSSMTSTATMGASGSQFGLSQNQQPQMQQMQHQMSAMSAVAPPGAHIVTLPPGAMPPPGSVPMMTFSTGPQIQQSNNSNLAPFNPAVQPPFFTQ